MKRSFLLITFSALYCIVTTGQEIKSEIGIKDISKPHSELSVAHGKLVSFKIQENPRLFSYAIYDLLSINRGPLNGNTVMAHFYASTLQEPLPEDAILILHTLHYNDIQNTRTYCAVGLEAWRGVLPFSEEKWNEICETPSSVLGQSSPEDRLPLDRAIQIASQAARRHYEQDGLSVQQTQLDDKALRNNFSWVIPIAVTVHDRKRAGIYWRIIALVKISDTGVLLDYYPGREAEEVYEDGASTDEKLALLNKYTIEPAEAKGLTAHRVICKNASFSIPEINLEDNYDAVSEWGVMEEEVSPLAQNCPYIQWVRSLDPEKDFVLFIGILDGPESPWQYLDAATARNGIRIGYSLQKSSVAPKE